MCVVGAVNESDAWQTSTIYKGMAQSRGKGTQTFWEMVVVPSGKEQQVTSARGLEIPRS